MSRRTGRLAAAVVAVLTATLLVPVAMAAEAAPRSVEALTLTMPEGGGKLHIRGGATTQDLARPTTVSGSIDPLTGAITAASFATPTISFTQEITSPLPATVYIDATFSEVTPGTATGSVDYLGNVVLRDRLRADLHIKVGNPAFLTADCSSAPINLEFQSTAPYNAGTQRVTLADADFTVPPVLQTGTCDNIVAPAINKQLAGSGHSLSVAFDGAITLPPKPGDPSTTTLAVSPAGGSRFGDEVTLSATVAPADATDTTTPIGDVDFFDGTRLLGTEPTTAGVATFTTSTFGAGPHRLSARYRGAGDHAASTSATASYLVAATPALTHDLPPFAVIGADPIEFDVQATNPGLGAAVENARIDVRTNSQLLPAAGILLEVQAGDGTWSPVPLAPDPVAANTLVAPIGPATGFALPANSEHNVHLRVSFPTVNPPTRPGEVNVTFDLLTVDPTTGVAGDTLSSGTGSLTIGAADREATRFTEDFGFFLTPVRPAVIRPGNVLEVGPIVEPLVADRPQPTGQLEYSLDGVPIPAMIVTAGSAGYQLRVPYNPGVPAQIALPGTLAAGPHVLSVRYLGSSLYLPSEVSYPITVLPSAGPSYDCNIETASPLPLHFRANVVAQADVPTSRPNATTATLGRLDIRMLIDRGPSYTSLGQYPEAEMPVGTNGIQGIDFAFKGGGTGSATSMQQTNSYYLDDPSDTAYDKVLEFRGETGSVPVSGQPGDQVPVDLDSIVIRAVDVIGAPYVITCLPLQGPAELGSVTVSGTTLAVTAPTTTRAGDAVTLTAKVAPATAGGTVLFYDGTTNIGAASVVAGVAAMETTDLSVGDHALTARFLPSTPVPASASTPVALRVRAALRCPDQAVAGNRAFVRLAFLEVLDRCATTERSNHWTDQLDGGLTKTAFGTTVTTGNEAVGEVVDDAYQQVLGRNPSTQVRPSRVAEVTKTGYTRLLGVLAGSDELWTQAGATNGGYVDLVYARLEGRAAPAAARASWVAFLAKGGSRPQMAAFVAAGPDALARTVTLRYQDLLGRAPGAGPLATRVRALQADGSRSKLDAALVGSDEFAVRAGAFLNPDE